MPPAHDEFFERVIRDIRALPAAQQHGALLQFTAVMLRSMDHATIEHIRDEIDSTLGRTHEGQDILHLIDGHLALREIEQT